MVDVLVIGGGNAALCAALTAREAGASVLLLEAAPREWRGGNSQHTRNLRCMHDAPQDVLVDSYPEEEYWQDLLRVTEGNTNEALARLVIRTSSQCRDWMRQHGVNFQPPLSGALHVARTNAFFMGGGKALVNAYYRSAEQMGVQIRYNTPVQALELRNGEFVAALAGEERIVAKSCVLAAGGFESNREWLREAWGQNDRGEWPADNFLIRGTRFNQGVLLKFMIDAGPISSAILLSPTASPLTPGRRSMTAGSAPASTAFRWGWWSTAMPCAFMMKGKISGLNATPSGADWSPTSPARSATRSSTAKPSATLCPRSFPALRPIPSRNWPASWGLTANV